MLKMVENSIKIIHYLIFFLRRNVFTIFFLLIDVHTNKTGLLTVVKHLNKETTDFRLSET